MRDARPLQVHVFVMLLLNVHYYLFLNIIKFPLLVQYVMFFFCIVFVCVCMCRVVHQYVSLCVCSL